MHLFSPPHIAASSGIVGASGPAAAGFALAAQLLRPEAVAVAFFGEGAANQGMLLESLNLAAIWKLPVLFICKDNQWAITTPSVTVVAGNLAERARGFGMPAIELDGSDVKAVWHAAGEAVERARIGGGPTFLQASCTRFEGHYLGDALLRRAHNPLKEMRPSVVPMLKAVLARQGAPRRERLDNLRTIASLIQSVKREQSALERDPIFQTRQFLASDVDRLEGLESKIVQEIQSVVNCALSTPPVVLQR